jgi:hypothetical protein
VPLPKAFQPVRDVYTYQLATAGPDPTVPESHRYLAGVASSAAAKARNGELGGCHFAFKAPRWGHAAWQRVCTCSPAAGTGGWRLRCRLHPPQQPPALFSCPNTRNDLLQRGLLAGVLLLLAVAGSAHAAVDAGGAAVTGGPAEPNALSYGGVGCPCLPLPSLLLWWS